MGMWSNSNKNQEGSNVHTTINQGGGSAKAGTFPTANRDSYWVAIFHGGVDPTNKVMKCCNATHVNYYLTIYQIDIYIN